MEGESGSTVGYGVSSAWQQAFAWWEREKIQGVQSASLEEQVLADSLKLLSRFYSIYRVQDCPKVEDLRLELNNFKCKQLLETLLESDKEPLLQAAACRVLRALFPKKEVYYQVMI